MEERLLYRTISGLHTSINTQLSWFYIDHDLDIMMQNTNLFFTKVGDHPERIRNLYFAYSMLLRAINVAADYIQGYDYDTGNLDNDIKTQRDIQNLLNVTTTSCSHPFDESELFQNITNVILISIYRV